MRRLICICVLVAGCGGMPHPSLDMSEQGPPSTDLDVPGAPDMAHAGSAPGGFGTTCTSSTDCRQYTTDMAPGFLGCGSFVGVNYCTTACGQSAGGATCWAGAMCQCFTHGNASGFQQTDCLCTR